MYAVGSFVVLFSYCHTERRRSRSRVYLRSVIANCFARLPHFVHNDKRKQRGNLIQNLTALFHSSLLLIPFEIRSTHFVRFGYAKSQAERYDISIRIGKPLLSHATMAWFYYTKRQPDFSQVRLPNLSVFVSLIYAYLCGKSPPYRTPSAYRLRCRYNAQKSGFSASFSLSIL